MVYNDFPPHFEPLCRGHHSQRGRGDLPSEGPARSVSRKRRGVSEEDRVKVDAKGVPSPFVL